jgi:hypothetical protein
MAIIQVEINVAGYKEVYEMFPGEYPYDCELSEEYPDEPVYVTKEGAWTTLREFELGLDGVYRPPYILI